MTRLRLNVSLLSDAARERLDRLVDLARQDLVPPPDPAPSQDAAAEEARRRRVERLYGPRPQPAPKYPNKANLTLAKRQAALRKGTGDGLVGWERRQHDLIASGVVLEAGKTRSVKRVDSQRLLDRYRVRRQIGEHEWSAGDRLYQTWVASGCQQGRAGGVLIRVDGGGGERYSDRQMIARDRLSRALGGVGPEHASVLVHVCLCDLPTEDWAKAQGFHRRAGFACLLQALRALARHYGFQEARHLRLVGPARRAASTSGA